MKLVNLSKKKRGLATIAGTLLFVVLVVSVFAVVGLSLNSQTDIVVTGSDVADNDLKKQQEDFDLVSIRQEAGGFLKIELINRGQNPAEMFSIVMTNVTDVGQPTKIIEIPSETSFLPVGDDAPTNIVETLNLKMDIPVAPPDETYKFKIFSTLSDSDNAKTAKIVCKQSTGDCAPAAPSTGTSGLTAQLFLDKPVGVNTKTSTVLLFVSNNGTDKLTNVRPLQGNTTSDNLCDDMWLANPTSPAPQIDDVNPCYLGSPAPISLVPGQSALFKWDGTILGDVDDEVVFCNEASGDDQDGNPVFSGSVCDNLIVIDPNDCGFLDCSGGFGDADILDERFITRPELFLTIPSPYGEGHNSTVVTPPPIMRALWGANVVNPTDTTMYIQKITITAFPPSSNDNTNIVKGSNANPLICNPQDISPGRGTVPSPLVDPDLKQKDEAGSWSCPGQNTIMWFNYTDPIVLPPQSTFPMLTQLQGHSPVSINVESVLVDSTVYTTSGSFGKGNYQSTTYDDGMLANIYGTSDWLDPLNIDKIITNRNNIPSGSVQKFHIVLAERDLDEYSYINATTTIVVNVPRAFTNVNVIESETTSNIITAPVGVEPSVVIHIDGTTQIIATINEDIGDQITPEAAVLTFEATAPVVASDKLMVMYTLANGPGSNNNSVGPLSEIVLHVAPP